MQVTIATGEDLARLERHATINHSEAMIAQRQAEEATKQIRDIEMSVTNNMCSMHGEVTNLRGSITRMADERDVAMMFAKERMLAEADCQEFLAYRLRERAERLLPDGGAKPAATGEQYLLTAIAHKDGDSTKEEPGEESPASTQQDEQVPKRVDSPLQSSSMRGLHEQTDAKDAPKLSVDDPSQEPADTHRNVGVTADLDNIAPFAQKPWKPFAVDQMRPSGIKVPATHTEAFTWEHIHRQFRGEQYSPGLYLVKPTNRSKPALLSGRTYWLLESSYEPFAPSKPGAHGAKLTAFFNDTMDGHGNAPADSEYLDVPVFVGLSGDGEAQEYTYMGTYSQNRFSDKLSHSELHQHIPKKVLEYWAETLSDKDRPRWVTEQLIEHFWPKPKYEGPIPTDPAVTTPTTSVTETANPESALEKRVARSLEKYAQDLKQWRKEAEMRVGLLTKDALMGSWNKSDIDAEPGLRLWWEYLECTGYDEQLYNGLVARKKKRISSIPTVKSTIETATGQYDLPAPKGPPVLPEGKFKPTKRTTPPRASDTAVQVSEPNKGNLKSVRPWDEPKYARGWDLSRTDGTFADMSPRPPAETATRDNPFASADVEGLRKIHENFTKAKSNERRKKGPEEIKW